MITRPTHQRCIQHWSLLPLGLVLCGLFMATGCGKSEPPQFHLNMVTLVTNEVNGRDTQEDIATALAAVFGTPDAPIALAETGLDETKLRMSAGPVWSDEQGGKHGLYRLHCAHCHGVTGDGNGPTARFLKPYPRDFRAGKYKAKSTQRAAKPTDDDLRRVLRKGIHGTAMPSFKLLPPDEIDALVEYVKYLSMRGELEQRLIQFFGEEGLEDGERITDPALMREIVLEGEDYGLPAVVAPWEEAAEHIIQPSPEYQPKAWDERESAEQTASITKGRKLFFGTRAACSTCHGYTAVGDGTIDGYDDWNDPISKLAKIIKETDLSDYDKEVPSADDVEEGEVPKSEFQLGTETLVAQQHALEVSLPPRFIRPRNLRSGIFRFGGRPIDIYWRIREGINGTPMPAAALVVGGDGAAEGESEAEESEGDDAANDAAEEEGESKPASLTEAEIWNIVDYVLYGLPYESASQLPGESVENLRQRN